MFYRLIKILATFGIRFYCRNRWLQCESLKNLKGPAIISSNHPNSMLDAALAGIYCGQPIHYTIRSDVFNIAIFRNLLKGLNGIPFYRKRDGKGQLRNNVSTIEKSMEILKDGGIILIFSEGVSENEWKLKSLKSGIASMVWECRNNKSLMKSIRALPLGITYSNFDSGHKTIYICSGPAMEPFAGKEWETEGQWKNEFKEELLETMPSLSPQMHGKDKSSIDAWKFILTNFYQSSSYHSKDAINRLNELASSPSKRNFKPGHLPLTKNRLLLNSFLSVLLLVPAIAGYLFNGLFYFPLRAFAKNKTKGTIFFDSVYFGACVLLYPIYWLLPGILLSFTIPNYGWLWFIAAPITGWLAIEWNYHLSSLLNYINASPEEIKAGRNLFGL